MVLRGVIAKMSFSQLHHDNDLDPQLSFGDDSYSKFHPGAPHPLWHSHTALNWLHACSYTCRLTRAPWKEHLLQQPASLPALEGHLARLLKVKKTREWRNGLTGWRIIESWGSYQGVRGSLPPDSRSESSSSWNSCSRGRAGPSRAEPGWGEPGWLPSSPEMKSASNSLIRQM